MRQMDSYEPKTSLENPKKPDSQHVEHTQDPDDEDFSWNSDVITNLLAVYFCYFASSYAVAIPSVSIAFMIREWPLEAGNASWVGALPGLALSVLQIFIGDLSDAFGRRWFLIIGAAFGLAGMLIMSRASNLNTVIGGQALEAVGLTLGFLATPLLTEMVPKRSRGPIVAFGTLFSVLALVGGTLAQGAFMLNNIGGVNKGWRIGLYIGAGIWAITLVLVVFFYHPGPRPNPGNRSVKERLWKMDWIGFFLAGSGLCLFLVGLQFGDNPYPWNTVTVLAPLIVGLALLLGFGIWQWKGPTEKLIPFALFQHRNFAITLVLSFIEGMSILSASAFLPQEILSILTNDPFMSNVYNLSWGLSSVGGALITAIVIQKYKEAKWLVVGAISTLIVAVGLMAVEQPHINYAAWFFPTFVFGINVGILGILVPVIATLCTPNELVATSVAVGSCFRGLGGSIGVIVFNQILQSKLKVFLPQQVAEATVAAGLPLSSVEPLIQASLSQNPILIQAVPGVTPAILAALTSATEQAYADSYRFLWYALIPFCFVTLLAVLYLQPTKPQMTEEVASPVQQRLKHAHDHEKDSKIGSAAQRDDIDSVA